MNFTKQHAAVCGLFCPSCRNFIRTTEEPKRPEETLNQFNTPTEDTRCHGCRSDVRISYCNTCKLYYCSIEKGVDFCGQCSDYPCNDLKEFQATGAHRFELWKAHEKIKKVGYDKWMKEMIDHYSCSNCRTINSAYDQQCRSCGYQPSNQYVAQHGQEIVDFLKKNQPQ